MTLTPEDIAAGWIEYHPAINVPKSTERRWILAPGKDGFITKRLRAYRIVQPASAVEGGE